MKRFLRIACAVIIIASWTALVAWFVHREAVGLGRIQGVTSAMNVVVHTCRQGGVLFVEDGIAYRCSAWIVL